MVIGGGGRDNLIVVATAYGDVANAANHLSGGGDDDILDATSKATAEPYEDGPVADASNALSGGVGDDELRASAVAETYYGGPATATNSLSGDAGDDILEATASAGVVDAFSNDQLVVLAENVLSGGAGDDFLGATIMEGTPGESRLFGGQEDDVLEAVGGTTNRLDGGRGATRCPVDRETTSITSMTAPTPSPKRELERLVVASVTWTLGANCENLTLAGSGQIHGHGNDLANTISGNTAGNFLRGYQGADICSVAVAPTNCAVGWATTRSPSTSHRIRPGPPVTR